MAINGISTQQVSGISPNAGVSANGGASIESVSNAISAAANKGITPAGPTVTERDSRGSTYGFTPYHDHNGNKMVYLESRSASGVVSHMPLKLEQLESLRCSIIRGRIMVTNSEPQDRLLEELSACSAALSAIAEKLEAEGRSLEALTDAEQREIEALGKRVERCDRQLDECLKDTPPCGKGPMPHVWGLRV